MEFFRRAAALTLLALAPPPRALALVRGVRPHVRSPVLQAAAAGGGEAVSSPRVVVLGGGFGGLYTALRLAQLAEETDVRITLVDSRDKFTFLPLLYELVTEEATLEEVAPSFEDLLRDQANIDFVQATVKDVSFQDQRVAVERVGGDGEEHLRFDSAVFALGAEPVLPTSIPGLLEHAIPFYTVEDAHRLATELRGFRTSAASPGARVAVVGGGPGGVELACSLKDVAGIHEVNLLHSGPSILPSSSAANRQAAVDTLAKKNVNVQCDTTVTSIDEAGLDFQSDEGASNSRLDCDLVLWTAGSKPNSVLMNIVGDGAVPERDLSGRLVVDDTLMVRWEGEHPLADKIFAIGDIASTPTALPKTAQVAFQQSEYAAWNVWASLQGENQLRFRYTELGEMLSLGVSSGAITGPSGLPINFSGPAAALARRLVYAARMPTPAQRLVAGSRIFRDAPIRALSRLFDAASRPDKAK